MLLWLICLIVPMLEFVNKLVYGMRAHWNTWGRVSQARKRVWKEMMRFRLSVIFGIFGMDAGRYADELWQFFCTCAVVFQLKYWSRQSWHHYMMSQGSLMQWREGTIKESATEPWGCCYYCHLGVLTSIWVFTKPQTLYFSCLGAPRVGSISWKYSVVCFSISMHPDLFGGLWVIVTSFIWW